MSKNTYVVTQTDRQTGRQTLSNEEREFILVTMQNFDDVELVYVEMRRVCKIDQKLSHFFARILNFYDGRKAQSRVDKQSSEELGRRCQHQFMSL